VGLWTYTLNGLSFQWMVNSRNELVEWQNANAHMAWDVADGNLPPAALSSLLGC
jgi:hypothetical protein